MSDKAKFLELTERSRPSVVRQTPGGRSRIRDSVLEVWQEFERCRQMNTFERGCAIFRRAIRNIVSSWANSLLILSVVAAAMGVLGGVILVGETVQGYVMRERRSLSLSLFVRDETTPQQIEAILAEIRGIGVVTSALFQSKDAALDEFKDSLGNNAGILQGLDGRNPLPASIDIRLADNEQSLVTYEKLRRSYERHSAIETVQYNRTLFRHLSVLLEAIQMATLVLVVLVSIVAGAIIANTMNLALFAHRDELEISELLGALPRHTFSHYLLEGAVHGMIGSLVSLAGLWLAWRGGGLLAAMLELGESFSAMPFLSLGWCGALFLFGTCLGVLGSYGAVRRFRPR